MRSATGRLGIRFGFAGARAVSVSTALTGNNTCSRPPVTRGIERFLARRFGRYRKPARRPIPPQELRPTAHDPRSGDDGKASTRGGRYRAKVWRLLWPRNQTL
jgi:hypothetical protein